MLFSNFIAHRGKDPVNPQPLSAVPHFRSKLREQFGGFHTHRTPIGIGINGYRQHKYPIMSCVRHLNNAIRYVAPLLLVYSKL